MTEKHRPEEYVHQVAKELEVCLYVQYGAGLCGPPQWMNFDASPTLRLQRIPVIRQLFLRVGPSFPKTVTYGNIVSGLPIAQQSCAAIYTSHTLEHLTLEDFRAAVRNTFSYLRPGGTFRLVVPDLEHLIHEYLEDHEPEAAHEFMLRSCLGHKSHQSGLIPALRRLYGTSTHLWMWDFKSMEFELLQAGFIKIRRAEYGDAADPMYSLVEDRNRWTQCLGMECVRPS